MPKLIVIKGAGHGFRGDDDERAKSAMVEWFEKHLLVKKNVIRKSK